MLRMFEFECRVFELILAESLWKRWRAHAPTAKCFRRRWWRRASNNCVYCTIANTHSTYRVLAPHQSFRRNTSPPNKKPPLISLSNCSFAFCRTFHIKRNHRMFGAHFMSVYFYFFFLAGLRVAPYPLCVFNVWTLSFSMYQIVACLICVSPLPIAALLNLCEMCMQLFPFSKIPSTNACCSRVSMVSIICWAAQHIWYSTILCTIQSTGIQMRVF